MAEEDCEKSLFWFKMDQKCGSCLLLWTQFSQCSVTEIAWEKYRKTKNQNNQTTHFIMRCGSDPTRSKIPEKKNQPKPFETVG